MRGCGDSWFHERLRKITNYHSFSSQQVPPTNTQPRIFLFYSTSRSDRYASSVWQGSCLLPCRRRARVGKGTRTSAMINRFRHRMDAIKTRLVAQRRQRKETERTTMKPRVRIIKRDAGSIRNILPTNQSEKTDRQLDREMVNTVKSWVAECEARNRLARAAALSLVHSLEVSRQKLAAPVRV